MLVATIFFFIPPEAKGSRSARGPWSSDSYTAARELVLSWSTVSPTERMNN